MRTLLVCLQCEAKFFERTSGINHRCGNCGSSAVVKNDDLRRGGLALKPAANFWLLHDQGKLPTPPPPWEVIGFPANTAALFAVMGKARTTERRRRAAKLMLVEVGFPEEIARDLGEKMYSD